MTIVTSSKGDWIISGAAGDTPVEAVYTTVSCMGIDAFGINCSTGPLEMEDCIRWLSDAGNTAHPILVVPNAGIPDMAKNNGECNTSTF